ncbi:MAG: hypothetical protein HND48_06530 [Chloroflexi bacterium]|nr:hypothetical protein [Chloroflexota bacterium]
MPTRKWVYSDAHVQSVTYSDFDTASSEMVEERIVLHYGSVTHEWLA